MCDQKLWVEGTYKTENTMKSVRQKAAVTGIERTAMKERISRDVLVEIVWQTNVFKWKVFTFFAPPNIGQSVVSFDG